MRRTMLVLAVVALLVVALAAPAFAGYARGQYNTNRGYYENNYNPSNNIGYFYGGDVYHVHGNGDWRN